MDFRSRFFAPKYGIDEDPVTGSAHCCLGPYWSSKLGRFVGEFQLIINKDDRNFNFLLDISGVFVT